MKYRASVGGKAGDRELLLGNEAAVSSVLETHWSDSSGIRDDTRDVMSYRAGK